MAASTIRQAQLHDRDAVIEMRLLLWPDCSREEEGPQFEALVGSGMAGTLPAVSLVAQGGTGSLPDLLKSACAPTPTGATPRGQWATLKAGSFAKDSVARALVPP